MTLNMTFKDYSEKFIQKIQSRNRRPVKPGTVRIYQSYLDSRILPELGDLELVHIDNGKARGLVQNLNQAGLAPATVNAIFKVVEMVIASAVDQNGNELFPRKWNHEFIDLPVVNQSEQDSQIVTTEQVNAAILNGSKPDQGMFALLAASGLRIGEALALHTGSDDGLNSFWDRETGILTVRRTLDLTSGLLGPAKTRDSVRQVDLHKDVNDFLQSRLPVGGRLFTSQTGEYARYNTLLDRLEDVGITEGFHAFRRFRITHLESMNVPRGLSMYWTGHAAKDVHETYIRMGQDLHIRREWAQKAQYGFKLP